MKLKNLTPHSLTLHGQDGNVINLEPSGIVPRLAPSREDLGIIGGLPIVRTVLGDPVGLPEPEENTLLIVSALVAEHTAVADREDLAYPGEAVRDESGRIVGAKGLCAGPGLARKLAKG